MTHPIKTHFSLALLALHALPGIWIVHAQPIDVYDPSGWERPVLIAHRGGVITPESAENTEAAVRMAAEQGFAMVEVDVRETRDHVPVAFHDGNLLKATGTDARVEDLTLEEVTALRHKRTDQEILTLDEFLELCARLNLGVMLDIKTDGSGQFFRQLAELIRKHGLDRSAVTFYGAPLAVEHLRGSVMFSVTSEEMELVARGEAVDLNGRFWFGLPRDIDADMIRRLQERGAFVVPAINTFRYPDDQHMEQAAKDVERMMEAGADAYQIDSVYSGLFPMNRSDDDQ